MRTIVLAAASAALMIMTANPALACGGGGYSYRAPHHAKVAAAPAASENSRGWRGHLPFRKRPRRPPRSPRLPQSRPPGSRYGGSGSWSRSRSRDCFPRSPGKERHSHHIGRTHCGLLRGGSRSALAARQLAVGPSKGLVGLDGIGDELQLRGLGCALQRARQRICTQDQQGMHGVGFGDERPIFEWVACRQEADQAGDRGLRRQPALSSGV